MFFKKKPSQRTGLSIEDAKKRTPPGQYLTDKFPVLTYGPTPSFNPETWDFRVWGLVEQPARWTYEQFMQLPTVEITADFHCVTTWSRLENRWEGVAIHEIMKHVQLKPEAQFAMFHCDGGYTANISLDALLDDDVLLAYKLDGENIDPEHGWPLRSIVPKRYAWKSAKWLRGIEFMPADQPGFWERNGYHMDGDPWKEERYR